MTLAAELIDALDGEVGGRVYTRETVPEHTPFPYCTFLVNAFDGPEGLDGDGKTLAWRTMAQVDLWEKVEDEDPALVRSVRTALNGLAMSTDGFLRLRVQGVVRVPEEPPIKVTHHAFTVQAAELE